MAQGLLGLPPGLRGYRAGEFDALQRGQNSFGVTSGLLGLVGQNRQLSMQEQTQPLQLELLRQQVENARNPTPTRVDLGGSIGLFNRAGQKIGEIPKTATPDAMMRERGSMERHIIPSGSAVLGERGAQSRHDTPSAGARLQANVSMRGQDLTNQRSRDANAIAAEGKINDRVMSIRKEFNDVPEVKNFRTVIPIVESAKTSPDTPAGDLNLIYAVGKVLDPTSVVREGEMSLVIKSGSPLERFKGVVNYIQGGGRLTPQLRQELTTMLDGRVGELQRGYNSARELYGRSAAAQGLPQDQIFMENTYGRRGADAGKTPPVGAVIDGYRFKGGDPSNRSSWEKI